MHDTRITQQTSSTPLSLAAPHPVARELPRTAVEHPYNVNRTLQWLLDDLKDVELAVLGFVVAAALVIAAVHWWRARGRK